MSFTVYSEAYITPLFHTKCLIIIPAAQWDGLMWDEFIQVIILF